MHMWRIVQQHDCHAEHEHNTKQERQWCELYPQHDNHPRVPSTTSTTRTPTDDTTLFRNENIHSSTIHWRIVVDFNVPLPPICATSVNSIPSDMCNSFFLQWMIEVHTIGSSVFGSRTITWLSSEGTPLLIHEHETFKETTCNTSNHLWLQTCVEQQSDNDLGDSHKSNVDDMYSNECAVRFAPLITSSTWSEKHLWHELPPVVVRDTTCINVRYILQGHTDVTSTTTHRPCVRLVLHHVSDQQSQLVTRLIQPSMIVSPLTSLAPTLSSHPTLNNSIIRRLVLLTPSKSSSHCSSTKQYNTADLAYSVARWYQLADKYGWQCTQMTLIPSVLGTPGTLYIRVVAPESSTFAHDNSPPEVIITPELFELTLSHFTSIAASVPLMRIGHNVGLLRVPRYYIDSTSITGCYDMHDTTESPCNILEVNCATLVLASNGVTWINVMSSSTNSPNNPPRSLQTVISPRNLQMLAPVVTTWSCRFLSEVWRGLPHFQRTQVAAAFTRLCPSVHILLVVPRTQWSTGLMPLLQQLIRQYSVSMTTQQVDLQDNSFSSLSKRTKDPMHWRVTVMYWNDDMTISDDRHATVHDSTTEAICAWFCRACGPERLSFIALRQATAVQVRNVAKHVVSVTASTLVVVSPVRNLLQLNSNFSGILDTLVEDSCNSTVKVMRRDVVMARGVQLSDFGLTLA